jgi:hypothetical protein
LFVVPLAEIIGMVFAKGADALKVTGNRREKK